VIAVLVIALLAVPIPYNKTVGHDITLKIDGAGIDQSHVMAIAKELKSQLEADQVQIGILAENGGRSYELRANVPTGTGINPKQVVDAFASNLEELGHSVATEVSPIVERTSTTLYAYAQGQVIEISMDGKSSAEIEEEIRQALFTAGVTMAQVSVDVTENPDGTEEVRIEVEAECADSNPCDEHPTIRLTKEGAALDGDFQDVAVRIKKLAADDGTTTLVAEIVRDGQPVEVEVADADNMSDMELASALENALAQEGVSAQVDIVDGKIEIKLDQ
jgi:type IV pilus biogenesis protein CpaD/CtpE